MDAEDTINAVLDLHRPVEWGDDRLCAECIEYDPCGLSGGAPWPCETVKVIVRCTDQLLDGMTWCDLDGHDYPDEWDFHSHAYEQVRNGKGKWLRTPCTYLVKMCAACGDLKFYEMLGIHADPKRWRPDT